MPVKKRAHPVSRLSRLQRLLTRPIILTTLPGIRYLSGFTGSYAILLIFPDRAWFITDRRYAEQSQREVGEGMEVLFQKKSLPQTLSPLLKGVSSVGLEDASSLALYNQLQGALKGIDLVATPSPVDALRQVKDRHEVARIEAALRLTEEVMVYTAGILKPGMAEREVAASMERYARIKGADGVSFPTIVASGPRSSLPHGEAGGRIIEKNELVLFDFGFILDGYCSDFTRVLYTGSQLPVRIKRVWSLVREAQEIGFDAIKAGESSALPDIRVREFFRSKRVLSRYEHSLGHGVGLEIHESPRLSEKSSTLMEAGMVVTVEPGLYYPGRFGIRLEDMVLITRSGARRLTSFPLNIGCVG